MKKTKKLRLIPWKVRERMKKSKKPPLRSTTVRDAMIIYRCVALFCFCSYVCFSCFQEMVDKTEYTTQQPTNQSNQSKGNRDHWYQIAISMCQVWTPLNRPRHHFGPTPCHFFFFSSFCERPLVLQSFQTTHPLRASMS